MHTLRPLAAALCCVASVSLVSAFDITSSNDTWTPFPGAVAIRTDFITDQQTGSTESDIIGTSTQPGCMFKLEALSSTTGTLGFRIRVGRDNNPGGFNGTAHVGVDLNNDGKLDLFVTSTNSGSSAAIYILEAGSGANTSPSTTSIEDNTPLFTYAHGASNYNWSVVNSTIDPAVGTTNVDGTAGAGQTDQFLSWAIPFSDFVNAAAGLGFTVDKDTPMGFIASTSTQTNSLNQDIAGVSGGLNSTSTWIALGLLGNAVTPSGAAAPTTTGISNQSGTDGSAFSLATASSFSDPNGDTLTYGATGLPSGLSINSTTGAISGTLSNAASASSPYTVTVTATDPGSLSKSTSFALTIANPTPIAGADSFTTAFNTALNNTVAPNDSDPDGDALTFAKTTNPSHGTATVNANGTFTYTPTTGYSGADSFTYTVTDAQGANATATVSLTVSPATNAAPTTTGLANQSGADGAAFSFATASSFSDPNGDTLTFGASGLPSGLSINSSTGAISGTLSNTASASSPYTITVTATDPGALSGSTNFTLTVSNPSPTAGNDSFTTAFNTALNNTVASNDSDPDGDVLSFAKTTNPSHGTATVNANGTFTYTPTSGYSGADSFTYTVTDAQGANTTATVSLTVSAATNAAPTTTGLANQSGTDGAPFSFATASSFSDPNGDTLSFSASGLPAGLSINSGTGAISGTLSNAASGSSPYTITVTATDPGALSVSSSFTLTISNPAPIAGNDGFATPYNTALNGTVATNDSDPDGDTLSFAKTTNPSHGSATVNANGTFTYAPTSGYSGTDSFTYTVTDAQGASATGTVSITVSVAGNDPPTTSGISNRSATDGAVFSLAAGSYFSDPDTGDVLAFSAAGLPSGLSINPSTGAITGTLTKSASASGPYTITVTATDSGSLTVTTTFTLTVANPAPTNTGLAAQSGTDHSAFSLAAGAVFLDPDGDTMTFSASGLPAGLTLNTSSGAITGTLDKSASAGGPYTISVTATDADGATVSASFVLTVANPAPSAGADSFTAAFETAVTGSVASNDSDPDGDTLAFAKLANPAHGTATVGSNGSFTYTPATGFSGADSFTYTAMDADGASATATVSINVSAGPNSAPSAVADGFACKTGFLTASVATNDSDPDGDALTFAATSQPAHGTLAFTSNGSFTYTPDAGFHGADSFTYRATDTHNASSTATVMVTVSLPPVNTIAIVPALMDETLTPLRTAAGGPALQVSDPDSAALTVTVIASNGRISAQSLANVTVLAGSGNLDATLSIHGDIAAVNAVLAALSYKRATGASGADELRLTAIDLEDLSDSDVLTLELGTILVGGTSNDVSFRDRGLDPSTVREAQVTTFDTAIFDSVTLTTSPEGFRLVAVPQLATNGATRSANVVVSVTLMDGAVTQVNVPIVIYSPRVEILTALRLNPQTSLYEQSVQVINSTPVTLNGYQLVFGALPSGVSLYSATTTTAAGSPAIASAAPLLAGTTATYLVEYASTNLRAFTQPAIALQVTQGTAAQIPNGVTRTVDRVISATGRNYLEFATSMDSVYWVQYRDGASDPWLTSATPVSGSGSSIHWLDAGAPMTSGTPTASRQYQLLVTTAGVLPLQITQQPASARVAPSGTIALAVGAIGSGSLSYQWFHEGNAVSGATSSILEIPALDAKGEGDYRVRVSDGRNLVWSTAARVALSGVSAGRLVNLSVRARVESTPLITGFVLGGTAAHTIAARSVGPSLAAFGVQPVVENPRARLYFASAAIAENDDWRTDPFAAEADEALAHAGAFTLDINSADAALIRTLAPGAYTLHTVNPGASGIALAEFYETGSDDGLINISGRARVAGGDDALIAGFAVEGQSSVRVLIRAVGPTLQRFGVTDTLADPRLTLYRTGTAEPIAANDQWSDVAPTISAENLFEAVGAFALPANSADATLVLRLPPGTYTAVVSGPAGATGEALVEVYLVNF